MTNVYLAGPFFDDEQISRIERAEKALAANPQVNRVFSPRLSEIAGLTMHGDARMGHADFPNGCSPD